MATTLERLPEAVAQSLEGRRYQSPLDDEELGPSGPKSGARKRVTIDGYALTRRQAQILKLMASGLSRADIATQLGFSVKGIDYHLLQAKHVVGVRSLRLLYVWATEHGEELEAVAADVPQQGA